MIFAVTNSSCFTILPSWTGQLRCAKRTGSKRFLPKSTNGTGNTQIESNCQISADASSQGSMSAMARFQQLRFAPAKCGVILIVPQHANWQGY